jgi:hypothetical protein
MAGRQAALKGTVVACLVADGGDFRSRAVPSLELDFAGIVGDIHAGATRKAGAREPWYPRGTLIRNNRQLTLVGAEELAAVAKAMDLPRIAPEWIGANLVLAGVPGLTQLPAGTRLFLAGGAVLFVEGENAPCRIAGRSIAEHHPGRAGLDLLFPRAAQRRRGLIASVEKPGTIAAGETFRVRMPRQQREEA